MAGSRQDLKAVGGLSSGVGNVFLKCQVTKLSRLQEQGTKSRQLEQNTTNMATEHNNPTKTE